MWKPLLLAKLGENYRRVSAVFIWTYIKRLFSARDAHGAEGTARLRQSGGYRTVFETLLARIAQGGGEVRTGVEVAGGAARATAAASRSSPTASAAVFDKVIFTGPVDAMRKAVGPARSRRCRPVATSSISAWSAWRW